MIDVKNVRDGWFKGKGPFGSYGVFEATVYVVGCRVVSGAVEECLDNGFKGSPTYIHARSIGHLVEEAFVGWTWDYA